MTLVEGKKHEVRRAWAHFGFTVTRLIRESFGPFELEGLPSGQVVEVEPTEVERVMRKLQEDGRRADDSSDDQGKASPRSRRGLRWEI
jgi:23S rRNA pseudouridine2605 synthase